METAAKSLKKASVIKAQDSGFPRAPQKVYGVKRYKEAEEEE